jgi:hypothetical protein
MAAKYITNNALQNTFRNFISVLKDWLPLKKEEGKILIQIPSNAEGTPIIDVLEINNDGEVYLIGLDNDTQKDSLQKRIGSGGTIIVDNYSAAKKELKSKNLGRLVYLKQDETLNDITYISGLYTIGINNSSLHLYKIGETTGVSEDIGKRVDDLEVNVNSLNDWVESGGYTSDEIIEIINKSNK